MAERLQVIIWADPWMPDGYVLRQVFVGGCTDDGYWPNDRQVSEDELQRELAYLRRRPRTDIADMRREFFPFKRLGD